MRLSLTRVLENKRRSQHSPVTLEHEALAKTMLESMHHAHGFSLDLKCKDMTILFSEKLKA
jgi:hypothetical protein